MYTRSADNDFKQEPFTANTKCHSVLSKETKAILLFLLFTYQFHL